jgi:hypothetical protein
MITVEFKNGSASRAKAIGYGDLVWGGGEKDGDIPLQMRLGRCVKCGKQCKNL